MRRLGLAGLGLVAIVAVLGLAGPALADSVVFSDEFNDGEIDEERWPSTHGFSEDASCGAYSPPAAFNTGGHQMRQATTTSLDLEAGGTIEFHQRFGTTGNGGGCNDLDTRDVELQYSIDGGATWTTFAVYQDDGTRTEWTVTEEAVPPAAWTSATKFRWTQGHVWGQHWAMDDLVIRANEQVTVDAGPNATTVAAPDTSPNATLEPRNTPNVTVDGCTIDACREPTTVPGLSLATPGASTPRVCLPDGALCVDPVTVRPQAVDTDPVTVPAACDVGSSLCLGPVTVVGAQETPSVGLTVETDGVQARLAGLSAGPGLPTQTVTVPATPLTEAFEVTVCERPAPACQLPGDPSLGAEGEITVTVHVGDHAVEHTVPVLAGG